MFLSITISVFSEVSIFVFKPLLLAYFNISSNSGFNNGSAPVTEMAVIYPKFLSIAILLKQISKLKKHFAKWKLKNT